jgi:flagellar basal body rod protein FlgG
VRSNIVRSTAADGPAGVDTCLSNGHLNTQEQKAMSGQGSSLQALGAIGTALGNTAESIVNLFTGGYGPGSTSSGTDLLHAVEQGAGDLRAGSSGVVDIARDMVNLISLETSFEANVAVFRSVEQTTGAVLNLIT